MFYPSRGRGFGHCAYGGERKGGWSSHGARAGALETVLCPPQWFLFKGAAQPRSHVFPFITYISVPSIREIPTYEPIQSAIHEKRIPITTRTHTSFPALVTPASELSVRGHIGERLDKDCAGWAERGAAASQRPPREHRVIIIAGRARAQTHGVPRSPPSRQRACPGARPLGGYQAPTYSISRRSQTLGRHA